jgi:hypothetical protein
LDQLEKKNLYNLEDAKELNSDVLDIENSAGFISSNSSN